MHREQLDKIRDEVEKRGYFSQIRKWIVGETVAVGQKVEKNNIGIDVVKRQFHIVPRDDGTWYTLVGGVDIGESFSRNMVLEYAFRVLAMSEEEYIFELSARVKAASHA